MSGPTAGGGSDHAPDPGEEPRPAAPASIPRSDAVDPRAETAELPVVEAEDRQRPRRYTFRTVWDCDGPPIQRRLGLRVEEDDATARYAWQDAVLPDGQRLTLRV